VAKRTTPVERRPEARRAQPRRAYWQSVIAECRRSGLPQVEFCRRHRLVPGTFAYWKHTLARARRGARWGPGPDPASAPAFVPVRVVARPQPMSEIGGRAARSDGEIEIVLAGRRRVRLRGRVDAQWLGEILRTVERLGC
jgi:hypothetical protein